MLKLILLLISFFLGAIPFGYLVAQKIKKIDIRNYGSGNIGATNVFRIVGKKWGIFVFILDLLKGFAVPFFAFIFFPDRFELYFFIFLSLTAVLGHNWTPFLRFKGGKGVATSLGAILALYFPFFQDLRLVLPLTLLAWLAVFLFLRLVSAASIAAGAVFLISSLFFSESLEIKVLAVILFLLILLRHKENISRLAKGRESKV